MKRLFLRISTLLVFCGLIFFLSKTMIGVDKVSLVAEERTGIQPQFEDDKEELLRILVQTEGKAPLITVKPAAGGIIPHHLLAGFIIADYFNYLRAHQPRTIILLGPNHFEKGEKVIGGFYDWKTPFGVVETDQELARNFQKNGLITIDEEVLGSEHSIGNIMPFLKYYLPQTKIVPIVLRRNISLEQIQLMADELSKSLDGKTILVASIDFSHYLKLEEAEEKDKETLKAMENFNFRKILSFNNDYLDSPASLAVLLTAMKNQEKTDFFILHNTNSGEILKEASMPTTSYFSLVFH